MNSFHDNVNEKMPTESSPGRASGTVMRSMACSRVAPSTSALSSSSRGIDLKYPMSSQVPNGIRNVGYTRMSDQMELRSGGSQPKMLKLAMTAVSGRKSSVGGTR